MREDLLQILRCPSCRSTLSCSGRAEADGRIREAELRCSRCARTNPVINGIPRFVPRENYASSFGEQWKRFRRIQLDRYNGTRLSERRLLAETVLPAEWWRDRLVLDVGCGAGRFVDVAARFGARVVGVDYSEAVDAAADNLGDDPLVDLVQADVYALPFAEGAFDAVYCIGVVQHTPDPLRAVAALPAMARPGGWVALTAYERRAMTRFFSKYLFRALLRPLSTPAKLRMITAAMPVLFPLTSVLFRIPLMGRLFRFVIPVANYVHATELSREQRYEWALLDTLDMLAPTYDIPQRESEVIGALRRAGLTDVRRLPTPGLTVVGRRPEGPTV